jgi:hypothetical protein
LIEGDNSLSSFRNDFSVWRNIEGIEPDARKRLGKKALSLKRPTSDLLACLQIVKDAPGSE